MLDFSPIRTITFDCYGTLIDWESGLLPVLRGILKNHGKTAPDDRLLELYGDFEQAAERPPYRSYREVLRDVVRRIGDEYSLPATESERSQLPDSLPGWQPWPDTVAALQKLSQRFKLCIISNVDDDLFAQTLPKLGINFEYVVTAQQARAYKPSRAIFELALQRIAPPAGSLLHVGQSIYHDVIPAQSFNLPAVWVNRPSARSGVGAVKAADAMPDLEVSSLADLARIACA